MPKVTIEYSPEEIAAENAKGKSLGMMECPKCKDSMIWKPFHYISYEVGKLVVENIHRKPTDNVLMIDGEKSQAVMCEDCWKSSSLKEREASCKSFLDSIPSCVKSIIKRARGEGDQVSYVDCPKDTQRFNKEIAAEEAHKQKILAAVRGGK
jgi:hypothetical protein